MSVLLHRILIEHVSVIIDEKIGYLKLDLIFEANLELEKCRSLKMSVKDDFYKPSFPFLPQLLSKQ